VSAAGRIATAIALVVGIATLPVDSLRRALLILSIVAISIAVARPRARWLVGRASATSVAIFAVTIPLLLAAEPARALAIGFRALAAALVALAIASTLSIAQVPRALRALGMPQILASTIYAMVWQLEHVSDEARRLLLARRLRGATGIGPGVMTSLLVRTRLRADRVSLAMELRGATAESATPTTRFTPRDAVVVVLALFAVFGLHWIR
jgi:energy-coupling factor transporter transmembrane protein EcfT